MTRNRTTVQTTFGLPTPAVPLFDPNAFVRMTTDLVLQANRMWLDLWFANLNRASTAFWDDVGARR